jgi:hypothetical protein
MALASATRAICSGTATPSTTYLRCELELEYIPQMGAEKIGRIGLLAESLRHIRLDEATSH